MMFNGTDNGYSNEMGTGCSNRLQPESNLYEENLFRALQTLIDGQEEVLVLVNKTLKSLNQKKSQSAETEWLDRAGAEKYLCMSRNTFEKYSNIKGHSIPKHLVGGKNYYRKRELDLFMITWKDKSLGIF